MVEWSTRVILLYRYRGGLEVPSWMVSDGTLRLFALTLSAYLQDFRGVYLIEEPENGIHPRAVETVVQSLSSVYAAQVLVATHSPGILGMVKPEDVLCFAKTKDGASDIVLGREHLLHYETGVARPTSRRSTPAASWDEEVSAGSATVARG